MGQFAKAITAAATGFGTGFAGTSGVMVTLPAGVGPGWWAPVLAGVISAVISGWAVYRVPNKPAA